MNDFNKDASTARQRRKFFLQSKKKISSSISPTLNPRQSQVNKGVGNLAHVVTPLSDVTSCVQNRYNQAQNNSQHILQTATQIHTQPSSCHNKEHHFPNQNLTHRGLNGLNLLNKFSATILNRASTSSNFMSENKRKQPDLAKFIDPIPARKKNKKQQVFIDDDNASTSNDEDDDESCLITDSDNDLEDDVNTQTGNPFLQGYYDIGDPTWECGQCGALMWYQERKAKSKHTTNPDFHKCCSNGKVILPVIRQPPSVLEHLFFDQKSADSKNFQLNIRLYNSMFAFTSPGMKLDTKFNRGKGPPTLRIQGQTCHRIGSLLPIRGQSPKYAQLYIYDTENEVQNRISGFRNNKDINEVIVRKLKIMLDEHNVHAKSFRMARDILKDNQHHDLKLRLISERTTDGRIYNQPTVSEVAALIVGDVDTGDKRDIILHERDGNLQRISEFHAAYLSYQYPLIFPYGEDGYRRGVLHQYPDDAIVTRKSRQTIMDWLSYRIQNRATDAKTLLCSRRLFQQFLVDGYTMMESERLQWLRNNQSKLRVGKYQKLTENDQSNTNDQSTKRGKRVVLPSSFVGSRRYLDQLYYDGMAISATFGFPDVFITFTCNPNWPEITRELNKFNLKPHDRPDLISRVFKIKLDCLMDDLTKKHVLGRVVAYLYTIEFQKRGLPHAHILIFLHPSSKYPKPEDIDKIITAEIPNQTTQTELYNLVKCHMIHGPCGLARPSCPCMKKGKCSKYFPKQWVEQTTVDQEGYPIYRRRQNGHTIVKNGIVLDNRHVVPYNPMLMLKYQAHINMEWCNQSSSIKYLFKYIHKGYDRITATIVNANKETQMDEIKQYLDCRYVSPSEACWRIFGYSIHARKPAVERMHFHLIGDNSVYFTDYSEIEEVLEKPSVTESMFTAWLQANADYDTARKLSYGQFVSKFTYNKRNRKWTPRKGGNTIGRLVWVPPTTGELYYLRMMLTAVKGPISYDAIKLVEGIQYITFREACFAMGFLKDDKEFIEAIRESFPWGSGYCLRWLFVTMLITDTINRPSHVWKKTNQWLSDDILYKQRRLARNLELQLSKEDIINLTLLEIEKILELNRRSLKEWPSLPYPKDYVIAKLGNRLIYEERNYDTESLKVEFQELYSKLTDEQKQIFLQIMKAVDTQKGGVFFLHGYGGTGKTFMWNTLASAIRSKLQIVLTVASSGIASLLLPGGRTAHSKFKIPVPTEDNSTCNIEYNDDHAVLLQQTKLIIWDEAPMAHRFCFEALDRTCKDIMSKHSNNNTIFGGKVVVFGGDFRQILPVIPRGSRSDIVHSSINSSYIWDHVQVMTLTKNMRLQSGNDPADQAEIAEFSKWILNVGEGKLAEPNDGIAEIDIPHELLITEFENPIQAIVESTYPNLLQNNGNFDWLRSRAILASKIEIVEEINDYVLSLIPGEEREYLSSNEVDRSEVNDDGFYDVLTLEFLNSLRTSGLPNHRIKLKVGTPVMLMRNIDQAQGLCNGTRLVITKLAKHVIAAKVISGQNKGTEIYIPRIEMSPSQSPWPFKLKRRQFPIIVSYAMTINKSQGQSLDCVGLYLPKPVFSHGQLYVALSRVKTKKGLKLLILDENKKPASSTTNVVFKEIFQNV